MTLSTTKAEVLAQSAMGEPMVTMRDIARFCAVSYRQTQAWRAAGVLPPPDFALGRVVRWRRVTIEKFITSRAAGER